MNWLRDHWQTKLLALALAIGLWLVIYLNPPIPTVYSGGVPVPGQRIPDRRPLP